MRNARCGSPHSRRRHACLAAALRRRDIDAFFRALDGAPRDRSGFETPISAQELLDLVNAEGRCCSTLTIFGTHVSEVVYVRKILQAPAVPQR